MIQMATDLFWLNQLWKFSDKVAKKNKKEKDSNDWGQLGFAGLILKALNNAGKKQDRIKKKETIKKEYW